jgi:hypothetical protein
VLPAFDRAAWTTNFGGNSQEIGVSSQKQATSCDMQRWHNEKTFTENNVIEILPIHFMAFGLERRPICGSELRSPTDERVTLLVEKVTCCHCLSVISHLLANRRNQNMRDTRPKGKEGEVK